MVDVSFSTLGGITLKLLEINGQLEIVSAGYILQRFDTGCKVNTVKKDSQSIQHFYRFCIKEGIDIHQLLASQTPFSMGQIEAYSAFCSININLGEQVNKKNYEQRMRITWAFIKWLWLFYQNRTKNDLDSLKAARLQFATMEAGFKLYLRAPFNTGKADKKGLPPELRARFFNIINPLPENELNPWKSEKIRWRNYALLLTMVLGGNRKGESLLLKLNDFALTGKRKYFEILKSGDIAYPRSEAPSVKTLGREVELSEMMAKIFEHYITVWRKKFRGADRSMYMFLSSRDGEPLCVHTPNAMLNTLITMYPEYQGLLSPHRLRNTFHDVLNDALNIQYAHESALSKKLKKAPIQEYAGGWAKGSEMPVEYPKGSIEREVAKIHQAIQQKILSSSDTVL